MTSTLPIQGLSYLQARVESVEGNLALVRTIKGMLKVRRDIQRAKGTWPQPGEDWIIDKAYGNEWTFALLITNRPEEPVSRSVIQVADAAERDALNDPYPGQQVFRTDIGGIDYYGADDDWHGTKTLPYLTPTASVAPHVSTFVAMTTTIGDPGWPYFLRFSGRVRWFSFASDWNIYPVDGSVVGGTILLPPVSVPRTTRPDNVPVSYEISGLSTVPMSDGRTVSIQFEKWGGDSGNGGQIDASSVDIFTKVTIEVVPR